MLWPSEFASFCVESFCGVDFVIETTEVNPTIVVPNLRFPFASFFAPSYAAKLARRAEPFSFAPSVILGITTDPQICALIIQTIAINMVNLQARGNLYNYPVQINLPPLAVKALQSTNRITAAPYKVSTPFHGKNPRRRVVINFCKKPPR